VGLARPGPGISQRAAKPLDHRDSGVGWSGDTAILLQRVMPLAKILGNGHGRAKLNGPRVAGARSLPASSQAFGVGPPEKFQALEIF